MDLWRELLRFRNGIFKCTALLAITCLCLAKIARGMTPFTSVHCLACKKSVASRCGFHCNCSLSWDSEWWIVEKCTWEGWGDCSQNFLMKKMPEENCAFNNSGVWVWHEVSLTCVPSIILLYVRVCLWQFWPECTWGSCNTLLEEDKNWLCDFQNIHLYWSLLLLETGERLYKVCDTAGIALESGITVGNSNVFLVPLKIVHSCFVWAF